MRIALICAALLYGTAAQASPSEITCNFRNDVRLTILASKGKVMFRFSGGEWRDGKGELEKDMVIISHMGPHGYMRVAFNLLQGGGYGVVRELPSQKIVWESPAVCEFK